jgi:superfamily II DNA/RNA helicase
MFASMTRFNELDLDEALLRGIAEVGFEAPTPVQAQVIPRALAGADLMVRAATGSGKTAAYLLPLLQRLLAHPRSAGGVRGLVLVPTRELARQVRAELGVLGGLTGLGATLLTGGEDRSRQAAALRRGPAVVIATPGRLLELADTGDADLALLEVLVLDEADRMLDMGFAPQVLDLIARCGAERQSLLFSATLRRNGIEAVAGALLRRPEVIELDAIREQHPDIGHQVMLSDGPDLKQAQLLALLGGEDVDRALVFVNARERAVALANFLIGRGQRAAALHGELDHKERKRVMGLFLDGTVPVLVATDLVARGLDLPGVGLVVNFDPPRSGSDYLHRSGRTGRAGRRGVALTLVGPSDWNRVESIVRYLNLEVQRRVIEGLEARFEGPTGRRRPKRADSAKTRPAKKDAPKVKNRLRDRKNIGKRRSPTDPGSPPSQGASPPRRGDPKG